MAETKPPPWKTVLFALFLDGDHFEWAVSGFRDEKGVLMNHGEHSQAFLRQPTHWREIDTQLET